MAKEFNDLFDDFLNKGKKVRKGLGKSLPKSDEPKDIPKDDTRSDTLKNEAKRIIDMISNMHNLLPMDNMINEQTEKMMDGSLGKPDKIEFYDEDGLFYERRTWHTPNGDIIKLIVTDDPSLIQPRVVEKPLQQQLKEAVAEENYEKAAAIRDKIVKKKNNNK